MAGGCHVGQLGAESSHIVRQAFSGYFPTEGMYHSRYLRQALTGLLLPYAQRKGAPPVTRQRAGLLRHPEGSHPPPCYAWPVFASLKFLLIDSSSVSSETASTLLYRGSHFLKVCSALS